MDNFTFCRGREHTTTIFFLFSWTLVESCRIQLQKKMANIWRIKRDGISVIKFSATPIHFLSDVFVAVAVLVAYSSLLFYRGNVTPYPISFKSLNVSSINWILNIMVQFCYLRLYLGIETVSCRLLLRMWQWWIWIKTWESSANFFKRPACKKFMVCASWWNFFEIFFITLQEHFVYGKRHWVMTLAQNWPKTALF